MKPELFHKDEIQSNLFGRADFRLLPVLKVDKNGIPILPNGENYQVVSAVRLVKGDIGKMAICILPETHKDVLFVIAVLAVEELLTTPTVQKTKTDEERQEVLVFKTGRSELQLHPNGKIQLVGDDVTVRSRGRMGIRGAYIDLN